MANIDLTKYGITGTKEIVYNPSYELLYKDEMDPSLTGFDKGQESELPEGDWFVHATDQPITSLVLAEVTA